MVSYQFLCSMSICYPSVNSHDKLSVHLYMFGFDSFLIQDTCGILIGMGEHVDGLYILRVASCTSKSIKPCTCITRADPNLWHDKLGHPCPSKSTFYNLLDCNISLNKSSYCHDCISSKQKCLPFPSIKNRASERLKLLHLDSWGRYHTPTHQGHQSYLTIVDDHSCITWVFLLRDKMKIPSIFLFYQFLNDSYNQYNLKVKKIQSTIMEPNLLISNSKQIASI